jgi:hypothetical protein
VLTALDNMQFECLRQLFGFSPKTKKETILTLVGLPRIRTRVAQLKLCFYNKLKTFDDSLYLKVLMRESFKAGRCSGLGSDIRSIHKEFSKFPIFVQTIGKHLDVNTVESDTNRFNATAKALLEGCDYRQCLECLAESVRGGSGQAGRTHAYLKGEQRPRLCPLLSLKPAHRSERTLLLRAISGCDFLTPHDFRKPPKCKFCSENRADWKHLFFLCPKCDGAGFIVKIREKLKCAFPDGFENAVAKNCLRLLNRLDRQKSFHELTNYVFGVCCTDTKDKIVPLRYQKVLSAILEVTAAQVASVHSAWFTDL